MRHDSPKLHQEVVVAHEVLHLHMFDVTGKALLPHHQRTAPHAICICKVLLLLLLLIVLQVLQQQQQAHTGTCSHTRQKAAVSLHHEAYKLLTTESASVLWHDLNQGNLVSNCRVQAYDSTAPLLPTLLLLNHLLVSVIIILILSSSVLHLLVLVWLHMPLLLLL